MSDRERPSRVVIRSEALLSVVDIELTPDQVRSPDDGWGAVGEEFSEEDLGESPAASEVQGRLVEAVVRERGELIDSFALALRPVGEPSAASVGSTEVLVPVPPGVTALLLLIQDGVYSWVLPDRLPAEEAFGVIPGAETLRFRLKTFFGVTAKTIEDYELAELFAAAVEPFIASEALAPMPLSTLNKGKVLIFQFGLGALGLTAFKKWEQSRRRMGLRLYTPGNPSQPWTDLDRSSPGLPLPASGKPAKRLVVYLPGLVKGLGSSFQDIEEHPFLQNSGGTALSLGFEYPAGTRTPQSAGFNLARELTGLLQDLPVQERPSRLDVVGYCTGGLVGRTLISQLRRGHQGERIPSDIRLHTIGTPHEGTRIVSHTHLRYFANVLTTLGAMSLTPLPGIHVAGELFGYVGALLAYLVERHQQILDGTTEIAAYDLAGWTAIDPESPSMRNLPKLDREWNAAAAHFQPYREGHHLQRAVYRAIDSILEVPHDGLAHRTSLVGGSRNPLDLPESHDTHHLNYFSSPQIREWLTERLEVE